MVSLWTVYTWELRKLRMQKRTYMGFAVAIAFLVAALSRIALGSATAAILTASALVAEIARGAHRARLVADAHGAGDRHRRGEVEHVDRAPAPDLPAVPGQRNRSRRRRLLKSTTQQW